MIVVLSDTHRTAGHGLAQPLLGAVRAASAVVHAGDFTTMDVLERFREAARRVVAVHGNADGTGVRDRLPTRQVVDVDGFRVAVVHGHRHSTTARSLLGREAGADLVVSGHTHRPSVARAGSVVLLNPGSHADSRGGPATYVTIEGDDGEDTEGVVGAIRGLDGSIRERFTVPTTDDE